MDILFSMITLAAIGYGVYRGLKWLMSSGLKQAAREKRLTPADIRVLEETAARLMADLRLVTDECVARIESACRLAEVRDSTDPPGAAEPVTEASAADEARRCGSTTGEVELLLGLRELASR